jgi:hypothetical protein
MTFLRICTFTLAATKLLMVDAVGAEKRFTLIAPNVVLANAAMAAELKSSTWKTAKGTWAPTEADALAAVKHLKSDQAAKEILACAGRDTNMDDSLKRIDSSRYQVFGLIIDGGRKLLIEASPTKASFDRFTPELWRKEIISVRVQDGGAAYWWALYDVNSSRFVSCNRRPDS